jgi:hypothetical protein
MKLTLTLDHTLVGGDQTDFPLTVHLGASVGSNNFDVTNIFTLLGANYDKMQILDALDADLYCEVEHWDESAETATLHIKVPTYSSSVDTVIRILYDPTQAANPTYVGVPGSAPGQNVWDADYVFVAHMSQDPTGGAGSILDSTSTGANGTPNGTMLAEDLVTGKVGKGLDFDGIDDFIQFSYDASHNITTTLTLESIIRPSTTLDSSLSSAVGILERQQTPLASQDSYSFIISSNGTLALGSFGSSIKGTRATWSSGINYYVAGTYNSTGLVGGLFVDGTQEALTLDAYDTMAGSTNDLVVGDISSQDEFPGIIDEVRISKIVRSSDWISLTSDGFNDDAISWADDVTVSDLVANVPSAQMDARAGPATIVGNVPSATMDVRAGTAVMVANIPSATMAITAIAGTVADVAASIPSATMAATVAPYAEFSVAANIPSATGSLLTGTVMEANVPSATMTGVVSPGKVATFLANVPSATGSITILADNSAEIAANIPSATMSATCVLGSSTAMAANIPSATMAMRMDQQMNVSATIPMATMDVGTDAEATYGITRHIRGEIR